MYGTASKVSIVDVLTIITISVLVLSNLDVVSIVVNFVAKQAPVDRESTWLFVFGWILCEVRLSEIRFIIFFQLTHEGNKLRKLAARELIADDLLIKLVSLKSNDDLCHGPFQIEASM